MAIPIYSKVIHRPSGRTGLTIARQRSASVTGQGVLLPASVLVAWDDAASYPRNCSPNSLTVVGQGNRGDQVIWCPGIPEHGTRVRDRKLSA